MPPRSRRPVRRPPPAPVPVAFPQQYRDALILLGTVLVTAALYANSLGNGFIDFDDPENIVDNYAIRDLSWTNLQHWFSTPLQFMYTPLVNLSYALDYQVGGLDPTVYHVTNLLLHLGNVVLVFLVFRLLTGRSFIAHLVAAGFAVHPVNVDAVSWIATRSSLLSSFFFLGALLLYLVYTRDGASARGGRWWWLAAAVPVFALATLSKSPAVVLPLVLLLADYYLRRPPSWRLLLEKLPFFAISLVIGLVGLHFRSDQTVPYHYSALEKAFLICSSLVAYLVKFVVPYPLAFAYRYPAQLPWYLYLAPLLLAGLVWAFYRLARDARAVTFGLAFFAITIVLSQAVLLIDNFRSNRYAYLPYLGLFLIAAVLLERLRGWAAGRVLLVAVPAGLALVFGVLTVQRNALWVDTVSILSDSIAHEPDVPFTYTNRGISEYKAGNDAAALADFETTLRLDHESQLAYYYRGLVKFGRQDYRGAIADYDQAIARSNVFSAAYSDRGRAKRELKDYQGALADYNTAISLNGYFADAFFNRGIVRHDLGDDNGAVADYSQTLAYSPDFPEAYNNRGSARLSLGDAAGALSDFDRAIALNANYADAWFNRGQTRIGQGDRGGACTDWRQAGQLGSAAATDLITKDCPAP
jgi:tetratricopeptide (TPR) repeat protein